jgi:NADP-dependent aldehyde dehydrogenase
MESKDVSQYSVASMGNSFRALNPVSGEQIDPEFNSSTAEQVDAAANSASDAFAAYRALSGKERAAFLRTIADGLDAATEELAWRAQQETALPAPRLQGEVKRASNQFRLFAEVLEEG